MVARRGGASYVLFRLLSSVLVVASVVAIFDAAANACECSEGPWTVTDDLEFSELVFRGVVTSLERTDGGGYEVDFSVTTSWKGSVGSETTVWTPDPSDQCGYQFQEGVEYVVFVWDDTVWVAGPRYISSCSRTATATSARIALAELGPGTTVDRQADPQAPEDPVDRASMSEKTWFIPVVAVLIASTMGLVWRFRKRLGPRPR